MNFTEILAALTAIDLNHRTETDGTVIADCPICNLENKGDGKLKIFADGNFTCLRFVGNDQSEHKRGIQTSLGLNKSASGKKPFLSETLFDGKLTFEIAPAGRDKQTVTARNCDSVLHLDRFNLADATARAKFVKVLDLDEADSVLCLKSLINLADRFGRVNEAVDEESGEPKPVSFVALADGRRAELTTRGFAVYDPNSQETTYEKRIVDEDGSVYVPSMTAEVAEKIGLFLPSGIEEYFSDEQLDADILGFVEKYVDISRQDLAVSCKYPRVTYRIDSLNEVPYLRAAGESGNGKSRFTQTIGLLCYRPLFTVGITAAALFRVVDAFKPTLIIDEFNIKSSSEDTEAILQVLNSGYQRLTRVIRCSSDGKNFTPDGFDPFGAKILAGLKMTDSQPFESRTYPVRLEETTRNDIPLQLLPEMIAEAEVIRNKLTLWRLRSIDQSLSSNLREAEQALKDAGGIKKRLIQISIPLYAMLDSAEVKTNFVEQLKQRTKDVSAERSQTLEGQLVERIHSKLFTEDENGNWTNAECDSSLIIGQEGKADERLRIAAITDDVNADLPDKRKHNAEYIGKTLSGSLHLKSDYIQRRKSDYYKKRALQFNQKRLDSLFKIYNLPVPPDFTIRTVRSDETLPESTIKLRTANANDLPKIASLFADKPHQTNDLTDCEQCEQQDFGKSLEIDCEQETESAIRTNNLPEFMKNCVALDTETEAFDEKRGITPQNANMIGMSLSSDGDAADYITDREAWSFCLPEPDQTVIFHNAKFDLGVLERAGLETPHEWEDTFIAACLLDEAGEHGLKPLAKQLLGVAEPDTFKDVERFRLIDPERFENYAKNDARFTFQLWQLFKPLLDVQDLTQLYTLEKQLVPIVRQMEAIGMKLDVAALKELDRFIKSESERLTQAVYEHAGTEFDLNSPNKTAIILYDKLGLTCPKETEKGARSVDAESLKELAGDHPIISVLLELRQLDKLASTFTKQLLKMRDTDDRIKAEFNQLGAKSGRFTCRKPNLQQVPSRSELGKRLRSCFIAGDGKKLVIADWSQMELRVLAHYSQDAELLKAYQSNADLHELTAQKMFKTIEVSKEQRTIAKMINFGIAYGITPTGLYRRLAAQNLSVSEADCEKFIKAYFATYAGVAKFLKAVETAVKKRGYVRSILGRRRRVSGCDRREIRQAQNFVIQATAADLAKIALLKLSQALPKGAQIISMIHDEFVIECDALVAEEVRQLTCGIMSETPENFTVKMEVEAKIVDRWSDAK